MQRYTKRSTLLPNKKWPLRWFKQKSSNRSLNCKNVQLTKSTSSLLFSPAPTSSNTSICSKQPTTFTSYMNFAMVVLSINSCKEKDHFQRNVLYSSLSRWLKLLRSYRAATSCIEILNLTIFLCTMEVSKLLILDSAHHSKMPTNLLKPCLAHPSIWHRKL